jgi:hypothetical protein
MNPIFFFLREPKHFQWILIVHGMCCGKDITPTGCSSIHQKDIRTMDCTVPKDLQWNRKTPVEYTNIPHQNNETLQLQFAQESSTMHL